jgi:hypothetical protein
MALRTRVWTAGKLLLLAGALVGTFILFAAASMRLALRAREVEVPDLSNRTSNEASAAVGDLGLSIRVDDARRTDPKIEADRVVAQDPAAGSTARRQRSIRVWLSSGPRAASVPLLVGETERAATTRLTQDNLELGGIAEIRSQAYPPEVVVAQDPPGKEPGAKVTLLVNRGEQGASYVMPDLIGVNSDRAADVLRERGFRVAIVGSRPYPGVAAGVVIGQNPQAGFQIAPGEPISIEVSR